MKVKVALTRAYTGRWVSWKNAFDSDCQFRFIPLPQSVGASQNADIETMYLQEPMENDQWPFRL
jgi:hypothetical protein